MLQNGMDTLLVEVGVSLANLVRQYEACLIFPLISGVARIFVMPGPEVDAERLHLMAFGDCLHYS